MCKHGVNLNWARQDDNSKLQEALVNIVQVLHDMTGRQLTNDELPFLNTVVEGHYYLDPNRTAGAKFANLISVRKLTKFGNGLFGV